MHEILGGEGAKGGMYSVTVECVIHDFKIQRNAVLKRYSATLYANGTVRRCTVKVERNDVLKRCGARLYCQGTAQRCANERRKGRVWREVGVAL